MQAVKEVSEGGSEKNLSNYVAEWNEAVDELTAILTWIDTELETLAANFNQHTESLELLKNNPEGITGDDFYKFAARASSDMNDFSNRVEVVLPKFEESISLLERSYSAYVSLADPKNSQDVSQIWNSRNSLSEMLSSIRVGNEVVMKQRDATLSIKNANISDEFNDAANRQSQAFDGLISNMEGLGEFAIKMMFLIDEKFGKPPISEDKAE